ncbi:uncharacterized protein DFL_002229 [Arthrobotrys flagrans]|uniref:PQ-loop repeat-containing protein 1 n=1 Tax=Arthrobotrys flagrans TaxID=97331 RepID=A0A437AAW5_ARTFL|nr:hypothetical protein DFL_002229 [Arthrobotrys flagrans]
MGVVQVLVEYVAPVFLVTSPVTSYADQIWSIHSQRSSLGFSLDIPLIMLVASILRIYYWFGVNFEFSLLVQSVIMVFVQTVLLKVALDHRPSKSAEAGVPFSSINGQDAERPYNFWQWRQQRPFWEFLLYFITIVGILQLLFGSSAFFVSLLGYLALGIEATLPIPQVIANYRNQSCKGFRVSVIVFWLLGDLLKGVFFTYSKTPMVFKLCGLCQFMFDLTLGYQYWAYTEKEGPIEMKKRRSLQIN